MTSEDREPPADHGDSRSSLSVHRPHRRMSAWLETILLVAAAVVVALVLKTFFVQAFYIPSGSMEPGLQLNDRILVEKPSYWLSGTPRRGDVVVFSDPGGWLTAEEAASPQNPVTRGLARIGLYPSGGHLVKRVIGVAGDTITCCDKHGRIKVNGHPIDESSYARPATFACGHPDRRGACYGPMPGTAHWSAGPVPKGFVFVMGDNRAHSADSTVHLCTAAVTDCAKSPWVPVHDVVGKVAAVVWPLGHARIEHRPSDFAGVPSP